MIKPSRFADTTSWRRYLAALSGTAAALISVTAADTMMNGELGTLTGPMVQLAFLGSGLLFAGAVIQIFSARAGLIASSIGFALTLPLASWLCAAGAWCQAIGNCEPDSTYPFFRFDLDSILWISLGSLSIIIQIYRKSGMYSE